MSQRQVATLLLTAAVLASPASAAGAAAVRRALAARSIAAAGVPDPHCSSGVISLKEEGEPQACCAGYCGECTDYPTCKEVRGQDSENACCKSDVLKSACGKAPANVCLKKCTEAVPPCIMEEGKTFKKPDPDARNAGQDCNEAVSDWRKKAEAATEVKKL